MQQFPRYMQKDRKGEKMPIITERREVLTVYERAAKKGWVIPCFCTENLTTTEAILSAANEFAEAWGLKSVPVTLAMTLRYTHRSQASNYTHSRNWETGLRLFKESAKILMRERGDYEHVDLLLHLDHVQPDLDKDFCESDLSGFSTIMYDASNFPFEENIRMTRKFVEKKGGEIVIEGACDEIADAGGDIHNEITTAEKCRDYKERTGVDLVVANLGTEHRASGKDLWYRKDAAKAIKSVIGPRVVLHGTSSVTNEQIKNLFEDGICKVNIWTALERDSTPRLAEWLVQSLSKAAGAKTAEKLYQDGYLTEKCLTGEKETLTAFTTAARQNIVFQEMKKIVRTYLDMWYTGVEE